MPAGPRVTSVCVSWAVRRPFSERGSAILPADAAERQGHRSKLTIAGLDACTQSRDVFGRACVRERRIGSFAECTGPGAPDRCSSPVRGLGEVD